MIFLLEKFLLFIVYPSVMSKHHSPLYVKLQKSGKWTSARRAFVMRAKSRPLPCCQYQCGAFSQFYIPSAPFCAVSFSHWRILFAHLRLTSFPCHHLLQQENGIIFNVIFPFRHSSRVPMEIFNIKQNEHKKYCEKKRNQNWAIQMVCVGKRYSDGEKLQVFACWSNVSWPITWSQIDTMTPHCITVRVNATFGLQKKASVQLELIVSNITTINVANT